MDVKPRLRWDADALGWEIRVDGHVYIAQANPLAPLRLRQQAWRWLPGAVVYAVRLQILHMARVRAELDEINSQPYPFQPFAARQRPN